MHQEVGGGPLNVSLETEQCVSTLWTSADILEVWKGFQEGNDWMMTHKELEYPLFL